MIVVTIRVLRRSQSHIILTMANKGSSLENDKKKLCDRCKSIPATAFLSSGKLTIVSEYEFGPTKPYQLIEGSNAFEELKLSAVAGCGLCMLFQDALQSSAIDPDKQFMRTPQYCEDGIRLRRNRLNNLEITYGLLCYHQLDARLIILSEQSITRLIEPPSYVIEAESDSPDNFALTRSWLKECCKDHVVCRDPLEFELPEHLLDVGIPSKPGIIRLVSAFDLPTKGRADYAALSHCWGSFQPLKTEKDSLPRHLLGIPDTQLPQTFHDAVRTTRELGIRYLWIDSLCIVQDDPKSLEAECARMNTIFANALCTISASDARDCRERLFRSRTVKPIRLTYEGDGFESKLTLIIQPTFSSYWMHGIQGPLQRRAWVLQERHLSPRVIHYTKKCLMWECRTAIASEYRQKMRAKADDNVAIRPALSSDRLLDGGRPKSGPKDIRSGLCKVNFNSLHDRWYRIVEDYSHRALSYPEDKLPGLSGFAAEWKRMKPEDEYFAGLWRSDIFKGLAWFPWSGLGPEDTMRPEPKPDTTWPPSSPFKGIPSWSWAAFDGTVAHFGDEWFNENLDDNESRTFEAGQQLPSPTPCPLRLHDVTTTLEQLSPFGHVSKGEITISSWSIAVTLSESDLSADRAGPKAYRVHPDLENVLTGLVYFDHDPFYLSKIQVRLLQLGMRKFIHVKKARVCGLALLQLQTDELTSNQELYRRVGMFDVHDHSFWSLRRECKALTIV